MATDGTLSGLRVKVRTLSRETARSFERVDKELAVLKTSIDLHAQRLQDIGEKLEELTARLDEADGDTALPVEVRDLATLKQFARAVFGDDWLTDYRAGGMKTACMELRDALANQYEDIERLNDQQQRHGYSAPEEKHADAIYRFDGAVWNIIDFCIASDAPGSLAEMLCWRIETIAPW